MSGTAPAPSSRSVAQVTLVIVVLLAFHWLTLRPGHSWGGDFAMYLAHGRNVVEGRDYSDTGYVFNPYHPRFGPRNYPPIFPLLLSAPYALVGPDIEFIKRYMLLLFTAFLVVFYLFARRRVTPAGALVALLAVGLNPYLWEIKGSLASEIPFLLFLYLALYLFDTLEEETSPGRELLLATLAGLAVYLCYGTRTLGIVLLPAIVASAAYQAWRARRVRAAPMVALGVAGLLMLLQASMLSVFEDYGSSVGGGLLENFPLGVLGNMADNLARFPLVLSWSWRSGQLPFPFEALVIVVLLGLAAVGLWSTLRRGPRVAEVFAVFYVGALAVLPFGGDLRRLLPVLPLFFLWVVRGVQHFPIVSAIQRRGVAVTAALLLTVSYVDNYARLDWGPLPEGIHRSTSVELFDYVQENLPAESVCLFFKPRVLAFYTGRPAAGYHESDGPQDLWKLIQEIDARYLIDGPGMQEDSPLRRLVAAGLAPVTLVWESDEFIVYRIGQAQGDADAW